ncbi:50S ribosomal protein L35ae [Candidatus Woesearchaeota archaeon]|nr:50S ribosomal protein L35ae [Candidatus Woesearchaeota archaeon]
MKAVITNYRRSGNQQTQNQAIIQVEGVNDRKTAEKFLDKTFTYKTETTEIKSTKVSFIGNNGKLKVIFERSLPGQALGKTVLIH